MNFCDHFCPYTTQLSQLIEDKIWSSIKEEAESIKASDDFLAGHIDKNICEHANLGSSLSHILATTFKDETISYEKWYELFNELYAKCYPYDASLTQSKTSESFGLDLDLEEEKIDEDRGLMIDQGTGLVVDETCIIAKNCDSLTYMAMYDLASIVDRDPACSGLVGPILNFKGFKGLQAHRLAHVLWNLGRKELACLIQSKASESFAMDIHPAAKIDRGLMIDHGTGLVVGETCTIGKNCAFLHGVTLGSTGKDKGDRHPKIGDYVLIGCNASVLGNIKIGPCSKIGSGSIVLKTLPCGVTAVGCPAKIVGKSSCECVNLLDNKEISMKNIMSRALPALNMDHALEDVAGFDGERWSIELFHKSSKSVTHRFARFAGKITRYFS